MCFNININVVQFKVMVDLPCYKIVSIIKSKPDTVQSLYYNKKYKFNEKYTLPIPIIPIADIYIEKGYHSYRCFDEDLERMLYFLNELQNRSTNRQKTLAIVKCIIPAGSYCYLDIIKEVMVSDMIIVKEIVKIKTTKSHKYDNATT